MRLFHRTKAKSYQFSQSCGRTDKTPTLREGGYFGLPRILWNLTTPKCVQEEYHSILETGSDNFN